MKLLFFNRIIVKVILMLCYLNVQAIPINIGFEESEKDHRLLAENMTNLLNKCLNVEAQYKAFKKTIDSNIELAIIRSDAAFYTYNGFEKHNQNSNVRAIGTLSTEKIHILVRNDSGIKRVRDMVGKVISIGNKNSYRYKHAQHILDTIGVFGQIKKDTSNIKTALTKLKQGSIHGLFYTAVAPSQIINNTVKSGDYRLITLDNSTLKTLISNYPFYVHSKINSAIKTIAVKPMLVARKQLSDSVVYAITKLIFENQDYFKLTNLELSKLREAVAIPFHSGASKYFNEYSIKDKPYSSASIAGYLQEGAEVKILKTKWNMHQIIQDDQKRAWIEKKSLKEIRLIKSSNRYQVKIYALSLRQLPSLKGRIIRYVKKGEYLKKIGESYDSIDNITWYQVIPEKDGQKGWVSAKYIKPVEDNTGTVVLAKRTQQHSNILSKVEKELLAVSCPYWKFDGTIPPPPCCRPPVENVKAAFAYVGPIGDVGWTYAHEQGRKKMEELYFVKQANFKEMVPEESEVAKNKIREFAKTNNLVFTTSWGYMDPTIDVAREYKDVIFMHCSGCETAPNVGNYFGRIYEPYYLIGIIAGRMTKSNILGFIGAFPIPEVIRHLNAFALGARSVNPEVKVLVKWVDSWYAPDKERDAAENLLDKGSDILSISTDSPAALKMAEKQGKLAFGYNSSMKQFAPDAYLTAPIWNWGILYKEIATAVYEGTWTPQSIWKGMNTGVVQLDLISKKVPLNVKRLVRTTENEIKNGEFNIFIGPIKDNNGTLQVAAGNIMTDKEMLCMNFLVEGVVDDSGSVPVPPEKVNKCCKKGGKWSNE